jgi:hypothetical protein
MKYENLENYQRYRETRHASLPCYFTPSAGLQDSITVKIPEQLYEVFQSYSGTSMDGSSLYPIQEDFLPYFRNYSSLRRWRRAFPFPTYRSRNTPESSMREKSILKHKAFIERKRLRTRLRRKIRKLARRPSSSIDAVQTVNIAPTLSSFIPSSTADVSIQQKIIEEVMSARELGLSKQEIRLKYYELKEVEDIPSSISYKQVLENLRMGLLIQMKKVDEQLRYFHKDHIPPPIDIVLKRLSDIIKSAGKEGMDEEKIILTYESDYSQKLMILFEFKQWKMHELLLHDVHGVSSSIVDGRRVFVDCSSVEDDKIKEKKAIADKFVEILQLAGEEGISLDTLPAKFEEMFQEPLNPAMFSSYREIIRFRGDAVYWKHDSNGQVQLYYKPAYQAKPPLVRPFFVPVSNDNPAQDVDEMLSKRIIQVVKASVKEGISEAVVRKKYQELFNEELKLDKKEFQKLVRKVGNLIMWSKNASGKAVICFKPYVFGWKQVGDTWQVNANVSSQGKKSLSISELQERLIKIIKSSEQNGMVSREIRDKYLEMFGEEFDSSVSYGEVLEKLKKDNPIRVKPFRGKTRFFHIDYLPAHLTSLNLSLQVGKSANMPTNGLFHAVKPVDQPSNDQSEATPAHASVIVEARKESSLEMETLRIKSRQQKLIAVIKSGKENGVHMKEINQKYEEMFGEKPDFQMKYLNFLRLLGNVSPIVPLSVDGKGKVAYIHEDYLSNKGNRISLPVTNEQSKILPPTEVCREVVPTDTLESQFSEVGFTSKLTVSSDNETDSSNMIPVDLKNIYGNIPSSAISEPSFSRNSISFLADRLIKVLKAAGVEGLNASQFTTRYQQLFNEKLESPFSFSQILRRREHLVHQSMDRNTVLRYHYKPYVDVTQFAVPLSISSSITSPSLSKKSAGQSSSLESSVVADRVSSELPISKSSKSDRAVVNSQDLHANLLITRVINIIKASTTKGVCIDDIPEKYYQLFGEELRTTSHISDILMEKEKLLRWSRDKYNRPVVHFKKFLVQLEKKTSSPLSPRAASNEQTFPSSHSVSSASMIVPSTSSSLPFSFSEDVVTSQFSPNQYHRPVEPEITPFTISFSEDTLSSQNFPAWTASEVSSASSTPQHESSPAGSNVIEKPASLIVEHLATTGVRQRSYNGSPAMSLGQVVPVVSKEVPIDVLTNRYIQVVRSCEKEGITVDAIPKKYQEIFGEPLCSVIHPRIILGRKPQLLKWENNKVFYKDFHRVTPPKSSIPTEYMHVNLKSPFRRIHQYS